MKFENGFSVQAPVEEVWAAVLDLERVAPAMPGAEVLERIDADAYKVAVRVKLGPMTMLYRGQVEIIERDDATHQAIMRAKAMEARGQGTANATVRMGLAEEADGTRATMETDLQLSGRAAAMGSGVIGDVSATLIQEFARNLARMLSAQPAVVAGASAGVAPDSRSMPPSFGGPPPASPAAPMAAPPQSSVPVGRIAAAVIGKRLSEPRTLLIATVTFAVLFLAIGFAIGRAT